MSRNKYLAYKSLLKPGIIRSNTLAALAGYLLASGTHIHYVSLIAVVVGMAFIISSACIYNNYFDREIDLKMARTKERPIAQGEVDNRIALLIASLLLVVGISAMAIFTSRLALVLALVGFIVYVNIYTPLKKRSVHGTIVGAISGAMPPAAGYCAYTGHFGIAALLLCLILVCWQMPHFFAIALYRLADYRAANVPVLPVKKGVEITKIYIMTYIAGLIVACGLLTLLGYAGWSFLIVMTSLNIWWLYKGKMSYDKLKADKWGRQMFLFSLIVITALSVMLALGNILP